MAAAQELPARARVVVIGGGIVGTSVAYHLAKRGVTDVLLCERNTLTSGTTWHAAGLVTLARPTAGMTEIVRESLGVFATLGEETGMSTGWRRTGTLHLATTDDRWAELRRAASVHRGCGVEVEQVGVERAVELFPLLRPDGIVGVMHYPADGRGTATDTTMALATGARRLGVRIAERTTVTATVTRNGRVTGVRTSAGDVEAEIVVNCTGMWGREVGAQAGVGIPLQALAHYYVVTDAIPGLPVDMPTIKSSDDSSYVKDDAGTLMVGFFEPGSTHWGSRGIPADADFVQLPENWDHIGPFYEQMVERIPVLADTGIRLFFGGPESFTPDGVYHFGPVSRLTDYWVAAGFNSIGYLSGPGAGKVLADWIVDGHPAVDLPEADPRRAQRHQTNRRYLESRVVETLDKAYTIHWPFEQRTSARGIRRSPLHAHVAAAGAVFGELAGWERANWYATAAGPTHYSYGFDRMPWFDRVAAEHRAVRETVGLFDLSSFGKLLVSGRDAEAFLQRACANDVAAGPQGGLDRITYSQVLNDRGGIEADVTVIRTGEHEFLVLTATAATHHDLDVLSRLVAETDRVSISDASAGMAMLAVMGPASRDLLQSLTDADLSAGAFAFGASREIDLGYTFARASRISYVGELGWELLIPSDQAAHVYETLAAAGEEFGMRHAGYHALDSLRLEKGFRSWGHDIGPLDDPVSAGLGFAVAWDKPGGFVGREAALRARDAGVPRRRLVSIALADAAPLAFHDEPVLVAERIAGRLCSAAYGHTVGAAVGLAWLAVDEPITRDWLAAADLSVEVAGERVPAKASLRAWYDPAGKLLRS